MKKELGILYFWINGCLFYLQVAQSQMQSLEVVKAFIHSW